MIGARFWLLNNRRIFFLGCLFSVQVLQIFIVLVFKVVIMLLSILSFISQWKQ
jgi:hypothetical protein